MKMVGFLDKALPDKTKERYKNATSLYPSFP